MRRLTLRILALAVACLAAPSFADEPAAFERNWPTWRGPFANGLGVDVDPPTTWSDTKNVRWKVAVPGKGSASPIVWENKVFVLTAIDTGNIVPAGGTLQRGQREPAPTTLYQFCAICYDRATGNEIWRTVCREEVPHEPAHATNTQASGSPVTDGKFVYASFGSYGIFCLDMNGKIVWQKDLGDMQTRNGFGEGSSPALYGDTLVVPWDHEGPSKIVALNAKTGDIVWEKERDELTTWMTPLVVEHAGRVQVVTNATNRSRSYDLKTGEVIWECGGQFTNAIAMPLVNGDLVYCMTGYRGYAVVAIPLDSKGDITDTDKIRWKRSDAGPYIASPLLYDGRLYYTKSRDAILYSVDATTGKSVIEGARMPELGTLYASPVAAKGRIYYSDRSGNTLVLKAGDKVDVLATNTLPEGIDASPAMVGKQMFIRTSGHLYCIEEQAGGE